jgi:cell division protein FtsQ
VIGPSVLHRPPSGTLTPRQGTNARIQEVTRQSNRSVARSRFAAKAKSNFVKAFVSILVAAAGVAAISVAWKLATDPRWTGLAAVEVRGAHREDPGGVAVSSGLVWGTSLARQDLSKARDRLLADPWILDAKAHRRWPHGVRLEIRERIPVADLGTGRWIAADGTVLPRRGDAVLPHLLSGDVSGGRLSPALLAPALVAIGRMEAEGWTDFAQAWVFRDGSIELDGGAGSPRLLVRPEDWKRALARWVALRRELGDRAALFSEIDLRHGSCVALRRAEGGA